MRNCRSYFQKGGVVVEFAWRNAAHIVRGMWDNLIFGRFKILGWSFDNNYGWRESLNIFIEYRTLAISNIDVFDQFNVVVYNDFQSYWK